MFCKLEVKNRPPFLKIHSVWAPRCPCQLILGCIWFEFWFREKRKRYFSVSTKSILRVFYFVFLPKKMCCVFHLMLIPEEMCSLFGQINAGSRLGPDFWAALIWSKALVGVYFCILCVVYFCAECELFVAMYVYSLLNETILLLADGLMQFWDLRKLQLFGFTSELLVASNRKI